MASPATVTTTLSGAFKSQNGDATVLVGAAPAVVLQFKTAGTGKTFVQVVSSGTSAALTAFSIQAQSTSDAPYVTLYSSAADFTAPKGLLFGASGDLTVLSGGASGWFLMETAMFTGIQVTVTSASTPTITAYASGV